MPPCGSRPRQAPTPPSGIFEKAGRGERYAAGVHRTDDGSDRAQGEESGVMCVDCHERPILNQKRGLCSRCYQRMVYSLHKNGGGLSDSKGLLMRDFLVQLGVEQPGTFLDLLSPELRARLEAKYPAVAA